MTLDTKLLDDILSRMIAAGLDELEFEDGPKRIVMRTGQGSQPVSVTREAVPVLAQSIGRLRLQHPRRDRPPVVPGDRVSKGMLLGYLEVDQTLSGVISDTDGVLSEVVATDGALVGYGQHVFTIAQED